MSEKHVRSKFLDPGLIKLESALLSRAGALEEEAKTHPAAGPSMLLVAMEFRRLAEELHYW